MKSKSFMLMVLSMGFGLIAAIGISQVMGRNKASAQPVTKMGPVLVAADHLDMHTLLTAENVKIENWPANIIPEDAATSIEDIEGKVNMARMTKGMPLVTTTLINEKDRDIMNIPPGFKVVAIKVSGDDTLCGLLQPGDKVDIIGFFKKRGRTGQMQTTSRTFLKALQVFSINNSMSAGATRDGQGTGSGGAIVSLLVNEKQSEDIYYVQKTGEIKLVMRGDFHEGDNDSESLSDIMDWDSKEELAEIDDSIEELLPMVPKLAPNQTAEMVIWIGNDPTKVTFQANELPISASPGSSTRGKEMEDYDEEEEEVDSGNFVGEEDDSRSSQQD